MTITLSVKLTSSTETCYVLSNGGEIPSRYGYALWYSKNYLHFRVNNKIKEWVASVPDIRGDELLRIQMKWSSQSGLQLIVGSEVKASTKTCASRVPHQYTVFTDLVIGGSSEKTKLCEMTIEYISFVCAFVNDTYFPPGNIFFLIIDLRIIVPLLFFSENIIISFFLNEFTVVYPPVWMLVYVNFLFNINFD